MPIAEEGAHKTAIIASIGLHQYSMIFPLKVYTYPAKSVSRSKLSPTQSHEQLKKFLGMINFYKKLIFYVL